MCSPMSWTSLSLSLRHCGDIQDTGEHVSARSFPYFSLRHHADAQDTSEHTVLAHVLDVSTPVPSTLRGHPGHGRAHQCSLISLFLSLRHHVDTQDMSEHTVLTHVLISLFDTLRTHRT